MNQNQDFMPYWKKEEECYEAAKVEGKDSITGKKVSTHWPRDKPTDQKEYELWLTMVKDPDTGKFYEQRDINGNTIKGTGPKHLVRQIVRIRTNDGKEFLYSNGRVTGFNVLGDAISEKCNNPEAWNRTGFLYEKEFDPKTMAMKKLLRGPNSKETIYEMPFNEKNLKMLYDKRKDDNVVFCLKEEKNGTVHDVKDATGIASKTLELFKKDFDYLYNADYISATQKAELRQQAIEMGLLPREAQAQGSQKEISPTNPLSGTYS